MKEKKIIIIKHTGEKRVIVVVVVREVGRLVMLHYMSTMGGR